MLAVGRRRRDGGGRRCQPVARPDGPAEGVERLVLPSPNGSTIAFALRDGGATVVGASPAQRHRGGAVARRPTSGRRGRRGGRRRAVAGRLAAARGRGPLGRRRRRRRPSVTRGLSPEAQLAADAFAAVRDRVPEAVAGCASGVELVDAGYADDVRIAADLDVSDVVPVLGVTRSSHSPR